MRSIASATRTPLVDLNALSLAAVQAMGPQEADKLARAGANFDHTHVGPLGAEQFSGIVARELARQVPDLAPAFAPGLHTAARGGD